MWRHTGRNSNIQRCQQRKREKMHTQTRHIDTVRRRKDKEEHRVSNTWTCGIPPCKPSPVKVRRQLQQIPRESTRIFTTSSSHPHDFSLTHPSCICYKRQPAHGLPHLQASPKTPRVPVNDRLLSRDWPRRGLCRLVCPGIDGCLCPDFSALQPPRM